ncbi:MAG: peptidylprolyl isomerase [Candidatus Brocadiia bacterium]
MTLLSVLLLAFLGGLCFADVSYEDPKGVGSECYKLSFGWIHMGWLKIDYKTASGTMTYEQEMEFGEARETVKIKATKDGIKNFSINGKTPKHQYSISGEVDMIAKPLEGKKGTEVVSYDLTATNFLPARSIRMLAFPFVSWTEKSTLMALDPSDQTETPEAVRNLGDKGDYVIDWAGSLEGGKVSIYGMVIPSCYGLLTATPCEAKEMKPKEKKDIRKVMDENKKYFDENEGFFEVEGYGEIAFTFNFAAAPQHCMRLRTLLERGWYVGKICHRLACLAGEGKGRILQGGSGDGRGSSGCEDGRTVPLEAVAPHDPWAIGMARTSEPNSANSQFYFCLDDVGGLNKRYTVWGNVIAGKEVLGKMWTDNYKGPNDSTPKKPLKISKCGLRKKAK